MEPSSRDSSFCGLRFVTIPRYQNGFGFTLRHFIVYPPDLYNEREDVNSIAAAEHFFKLGKVTEPVDTIFVKSVRENGPAALNGLCVGDRIVSVNGERIVGKSYDQVVHLIQKSTHKLYLEVSPKQYDTLQLFYEDKAYRPETNQRPPPTITSSLQQHQHPQSFENHRNLSQSVGYFGGANNNSNYFDTTKNLQNHSRSNNASHESFFVTPNNHHQYLPERYYYPLSTKMSSAFPNQQSQQQQPQNSSSQSQFLSHLPRPTPYKSSSTQWSHLTSSPLQSISISSISQSQRGQTQTTQQPRFQPQSYYPFQKPEFHDLRNGAEREQQRSLYGIREEAGCAGTTKSAESVLGGTTGNLSIGHNNMSTGSSAGSNNRFGSMECIPSASPVTWKNSPGYRFSISTGPEEISNSSSEETFRRESTISLEGSTSTTTSDQLLQQAQRDQMFVTMSGSNEIRSSDDLNKVPSFTSDKSQQQRGYEMKMADRIRRSCEQKEEFLRRPNQPMQWVPNQSSSSAAGFPKEFYAQPQKFQKVPWPPENTKVVVVSTSGTQPSSSASSVSDNIMTVTMRTPSKDKDSNKTTSIVTPQHKIQIEQLRNHSASLDETTNRKQESLSNKLRQQVLPKSSVNVNAIDNSRISSNAAASSLRDDRFSKSTEEESSAQTSWTVSDYNTTKVAKNRLTVVGGGKIHCDPPKDWVPSNETELLETSVDQLPMRPNYLQLPGSTLVNAVARTRNLAPAQRNTTVATNRLDSHVIMRKRDTDIDDNDRLVRRVSYLKATSSPIDMENRKNCTSPTTPTKSFDEERERVTLRKTSANAGLRRRSVAKLSAEFFPKGRIIRLKQFFERETQPSLFKFHSYNSPTSEFRQFGRYERSPDNSDVLRDGQVHFKVRAGDAKKGGYYRSWRNGWAQLRRSGCLYLSKEKLTKDTISGSETDVILCICLKDGVVIESADDYTKRKYVVRLKTSSVVPSSTPSGTSSSGGANEIVMIPVEILIQTEDPFDQIKWLQALQQQQDNNNYANNSKSVIINPIEMSSPKASLVRSLLQVANVTSSNTQQSFTASSPYLTVANAGTNAGGVSPKNKTWKGKVARQWKKMHLSSSSQNSTTNSFGQGSVADSGATFGVMLEDCPQSESSLVPKVLEFCIDTVEERGLSMVGIYRIPGNNAAVGALTESLNKGNEPNPDQDPRWKDVHVISSLLKSFLRKLPDPLLTSEHYQEFINAAADPDPDKALEKIKALIQDLPEINYETLRFLICHLRKVADHSEKNRMETRNLAIVFGPTVVRTCEENVASLVNDMQHQCKIMELLINNVDEIFKDKERGSPTPEEEILVRPVNVLPPAQPKIESDIKHSLFQAAQRKVLQQIVQPVVNIYGLPPNPRPIDEGGLIRSYAGLGEETEQRVKQFELETKALLLREGRSPINSKRSSEEIVTDPILLNRQKVEAELKKAKDDLENEDFYDQLADNPSSIVQHRGRGLASYSTASHNVSSSSISSTNSGGTPSAINAPYGVSTWPSRLGPAPFKSQASTPSLPPKPPHHQQRASTISSPTPVQQIVSPLKRISSSEKLSNSSEKLTRSSEYLSDGTSKITSDQPGTLKRLKNFESSALQNYDSKTFGSLDSLRDLVNGSREDLSPKSSDGSDLVTSLSKTLDKKLQLLRPINDNEEKQQQQQQEQQSPSEEERQKSINDDEDKGKENTKNSNNTNDVGITCTEVSSTTNEIEKERLDNKDIDDNSLKRTPCNGISREQHKLPKRSKSMIDRRKSDINSNEKDKEFVQHAHLGGNSWSGPLDDPLATLTKEAKTVSNKLKRECRRRHSLNGTADIFRLMFGSVDEFRKKKNSNNSSSGDGNNISSNNEPAAANLSTMLTSNNNNILESHV